MWKRVALSATAGFVSPPMLYALLPPDAYIPGTFSVIALMVAGAIACGCLCYDNEVTRQKRERMRESLNE